MKEVNGKLDARNQELEGLVKSLQEARDEITCLNDFSSKSFVKKDFSQVIAKGTSFKGSVLTGSRFYKAYLVNADFSYSDLTGVSLEDTR